MKTKRYVSFNQSVRSQYFWMTLFVLGCWMVVNPVRALGMIGLAASVLGFAWYGTKLIQHLRGK